MFFNHIISKLYFLQHMRHCRSLKRAFPVTTNSYDGPVGATGLHTYTPTVVSYAKAGAKRKKYSPIYSGCRCGSCLGQRKPSVKSLRRLRSRSTHAGLRTSHFCPGPSWRFSGGICLDQDGYGILRQDSQKAFLRANMTLI